MPAKDVGHGAKAVPRALMAVLCIELAWAVGARDAMLATASMVVMNACLQSAPVRRVGLQLCVCSGHSHLGDSFWLSSLR